MFVSVTTISWKEWESFWAYSFKYILRPSFFNLLVYKPADCIFLQNPNKNKTPELIFYFLFFRRCKQFIREQNKIGPIFGSKCPETVSVHFCPFGFYILTGFQWQKISAIDRCKILWTRLGYLVNQSKTMLAGTQSWQKWYRKSRYKSKSQSIANSSA